MRTDWPGSKIELRPSGNLGQAYCSEAVQMGRLGLATEPVDAMRRGASLQCPQDAQKLEFADVLGTLA